MGERARPGNFKRSVEREPTERHTQACLLKKADLLVNDTSLIQRSTMGAVSSLAGKQAVRISSVEIITVTGLILHKLQPEYETR